MILAHKKIGVQKSIMVVRSSLNDGLWTIKSEIIQRLQKFGINLDLEEFEISWKSGKREESSQIPWQ